MDRKQRWPLNAEGMRRDSRHLLAWAHWPHLTTSAPLRLPVHHYPIATQQKWQTSPSPPAALCVYTMKCHVYRRPLRRTGVNLLPQHGSLCLCSSSLPWPSLLMNMYGQVRSSTTARAPGTGAMENTKIRSITGSVSANPPHSPSIFSLAGNVGKKRKYITCWKIRLPTSWWHTESHCCRYTVTIFQLDDTHCWSGSVYCMWACGRRMANCLLWEEQTRAEMLHCEDGPASFDALAKRA